MHVALTSNAMRFIQYYHIELATGTFEPHHLIKLKEIYHYTEC